MAYMCVKALWVIWCCRPSTTHAGSFCFCNVFRTRRGASASKRMVLHVSFHGCLSDEDGRLRRLLREPAAAQVAVPALVHLLQPLADQRSSQDGINWHHQEVSREVFVELQKRFRILPNPSGSNNPNMESLGPIDTVRMMAFGALYHDIWVLGPSG